jgi:adenine-specific DNA-methyltransferase
MRGVALLADAALDASAPRSRHSAVHDNFELSLEAVRDALRNAKLRGGDRAEALPDAQRPTWGSAFSHHALRAFARLTVPGFHRSFAAAYSAQHLNSVERELADEIGQLATSLPLVEALHFLTALYPYFLPSRVRGARGAFYTPPCLSMRLLDLATEQGADWRTARVLDPAAGGGTFLVQAACRMREALVGCEPGQVLALIGSRLTGFELDPNAASLAQEALQIVLAELSSTSRRPIPRMVFVRNTIEVPADESFDLVIGNPPYGRATLTPDQRRRYSRSLYGHANLYSVFVDIALRWARPGGLIAYLTPTSFLSGQYYSALRGLLAKEAPPLAIDFVQARRGVFEDVLQETLLSVYEKGRAENRIQVNHLHVVGDREVKVARNGTVTLPRQPTRPWLAPRVAAHNTLLKKLVSMSACLSDWGYAVSTGPLVWNRHKTQLRYTYRGGKVYPLVWAEAVTADGRFVFRARKRNHAPYFQLEEGDDWLLVRTPCVLVQRTTAKEQARRLIAAELPADFVAAHGGVVVENHLNMVRAIKTSKIPPAVVAAVLNSQIVDEAFRCMNGSVAVSAFELEALPLPDPSELSTLIGVVRRQSARAAIEAECNRLYS